MCREEQSTSEEISGAEALLQYMLSEEVGYSGRVAEHLMSSPLLEPHLEIRQQFEELCTRPDNIERPMTILNSAVADVAVFLADTQSIAKAKALFDAYYDARNSVWCNGDAEAGVPSLHQNRGAILYQIAKQVGITNDLMREAGIPVLFEEEGCPSDDLMTQAFGNDQLKREIEEIIGSFPRIQQAFDEEGICAFPSMGETPLVILYGKIGDVIRSHVSGAKNYSVVRDMLRSLLKL